MSETGKQGILASVPVWLQGLAAVLAAIGAVIVAATGAGFFNKPAQSQYINHKIYPPVEFNDRGAPLALNVYVYVRSAPSLDAPRIANFPGNEVVQMGKIQNGWQPIKLLNGTEGWVQAGLIVKIPDRQSVNSFCEKQTEKVSVEYRPQVSICQN